MNRIDSHQHFWQISRGDYAWLSPEMTTLYRNFLPENLAATLDKEEINQTILVQAAATLEETEFMLNVARQTDFVAGVVGWVDMESQQAIAQLQKFQSNPFFKGIRPMLQDIEDVNWMLKSELAPVYEFLIEHQLTFDALVTPAHLDALYQLLMRYPKLNVVIDHGAKPNIAENSTPHWYEKMAKIAQETSAYCKLSGLVTEAGEDSSTEKLAPYMEHLLFCFGASRLMFGSDWPVLKLATSYSTWKQQVEQFVAPLTFAEQSKIWSENAKYFYRLT